MYVDNEWGFQDIFILGFKLATFNTLGKYLRQELSKIVDDLNRLMFQPFEMRQKK